MVYSTGDHLRIGSTGGGNNSRAASSDTRAIISRFLYGELMKTPTVRQIKIGLLIGVFVIAGFWLTGYGLGKYKAHANAKAIEFSSVDQMTRYNEIDRQVAMIRMQIQVLETDKRQIRDSLGVPSGFIEKRIDPQSFNSEVTGFIEQSSPQGKP